MTTGAMQTYAVIQARVPIFADSEMRRVTDAATKYLPRGATVSGQPTGQNNTVRLNDYSGFVSADAVAPCYCYSVINTTRVLELPRLDAFHSQGGSAFMYPGEQFDAAMVAPGWLWIISGAGYIPASAAHNAGATQPTYLAGERALNDLRINVMRDSHNLSLCAATFCDGDQSRYRELYAVVFRSDSEKSNDHKKVFPAWRRWFVGILQNFQHAAQH